MKTTEEKIAIMQAFLEGRKIEFDSFQKDNWEDWVSPEEPNWNWEQNDYRIKPETKYRPFKNAEEVMMVIKEKGSYLKKGGRYVQIRSFDDEYVWFGTTECGNTYKFLLGEVTFVDGTPFGKLL